MLLKTIGNSGRRYGTKAFPMLAQQNTREIIERYTDQPASIPPRVRAELNNLWNGEDIQLYAMADLDAGLRFARTWVVLSAMHVAVVRHTSGGSGGSRISSFARADITEVRETPGLSCTVLTVLGDPNEPPLAVLRYTHRQRRAMENIRFVLQQHIEGNSTTPSVAADHAYGEAVAQPIRDAQASVHSNRRAVVWRLMSYLTPYRGKVALGMAAAVGMTALALVPPFITGRLLDNVLKPAEAGTLSRGLAAQHAFTMLLIVAGAYLLKEACAWVRLRTMAMMGEEVARDLRRDLYEHLQKLSISYYSTKQTGSIMSRVTADTDRIWEFIALGMVEVSLSLVTLVGLGAVLLWLDVPLGLIITLPVPLLLWGIFSHGQKMQRLFLRAWRRWSSLQDVLSDTIPGVRVVRAFGQEEHEKRRFGKRNDECLRVFNDVHSTWTRFWPLLMLGIQGTLLLVWCLALPRLLYAPDAAHPLYLSTGTFVSFLLYMTMFAHPIEVMGQMARMLNRATSSARRVFEVLDTEPGIVDVQEPVRLEPLQGAVRFEQVCFAYDGVRQVLRNVSFDVKPGEMIGLVGASGSGKTTITNLIARFYEPSDGQIYIDDFDLATLDTGHYRRQVGMVLQDPFLFHGSILDNIRYGLEDATLEKVIEAARAANAHDFICRLPHGYDTMVGERGHTLSGGERQRISIARAVLGNPRILILDEATSAIDTETERNIQQALDRLVVGRTVFAIAHRLSTLRRADRLLVMREGQLVESGTHAELLARPDGIYYKLHQLQHELHRAHAV